ncbi:MAG: DUF2795 domain-containing protein [Gammaproteobacteria bacterium]|nr:DUF2795 domain-containing protein [Gammaproteobacteria bacterium]
MAVATTFLLSLLGAALGGGSLNAFDITSNQLATYGTGAAIWEIINLALSMAFGGYVAARLSGTHSHLDGELHGVTMWGVAVLLASLLLANALSGLFSTVGQGTSSAITRAVGEAGGISAIVPEANPQTLTERLEQTLSNGGDPTTMSHEQIGSEINTLVRSRVANNSLSDADRNRLVALVAAQSGITNDEASRRVTQMENEARARVGQVEQRARTLADQAAHAATTTAQALFTALTLGLLGALVGSWVGTRHKRALHPAEAHAQATAGLQPIRSAYEPTSVSVYDDTDHLVSQYLRGVSFPVNKQDLRRLARSGGPDLQQSIERMPEGSYHNVNEVLRALGMVH